MSSKGHYWYDKEPNECPICGKKFYPAPLHAWKIGSEKAKEKLVCSYTCMRVWEKDRTVLGSGKTYNTVGAESKRTRSRK